MLDKIIADVEKALDAEAYLSALALMMTIPDICAKAEYGNSIKHSSDRYIKWFEDFIGKYNCAPTEKDEVETPYFSGEIAYQLRCSILHEGHPSITKTKIKNKVNQIDFFTLIVEEKKEYDIYADVSAVISDIDGTIRTRSYEVNIRRLWGQIKSVASHYYEENKDKFVHQNYKIADMDQRKAKLERLRTK